MSRIDFFSVINIFRSAAGRERRKRIIMAAPSNYTHLGIEERKELEEYLRLPEITLKTIAAQMGRDPKCIREELKRHRQLRIRKNARNKCGKQNECTRNRLCTHCLTGLCKYCTHDNCNEICDQYFREPVCKRTTRFPYVCNGCPDIESCKLPHMLYISDIAQKEYENNVREKKKGPRLSEQELATVSKAVKNGVDKGHSIDVIVHENNLPVSPSTVYRYVHSRCIGGVVTVDLKRAVRYKIRNKPDVTPINYDYLNGRRWDDFLDRMDNDEPFNLWEMDTVIGKKGADEKCVLTLLYRRTNLQLYFLLDSCTMAEVNRVFNGIKRELGPELFRETFEVILTDNGKEFHDPLSLETDPDTGEKLIDIYYCRPRRSDSKAQCEKNHEHFREMVPKGKSMNSLTRVDVRYVSNNVNNYPRKKLGYKSPLEVSKPFLNEKVFKLNYLHPLKCNQVKLKPII